MDLTFLKKLTEAPGVPGREERIRELVKAEGVGPLRRVAGGPDG